MVSAKRDVYTMFRLLLTIKRPVRITPQRGSKDEIKVIKVNKKTLLNTELRQTYAATALLKYAFKFCVKALI